MPFADSAAFAAHVHEIEIYGYTVVPDVLSASQCEQLRQVLLACAERFGEGHSHRTPQAEGGVGAWHVANLPTMARSFHALVDHPKVLPLVEHFMGEDVILGSLSSRIVRPGDPQQGLHSDVGENMIGKDVTAEGEIVDADRGSPLMMNTVWCLQDTGRFNGGTRVVPGSHMSGMGELPDIWHGAENEPPLTVQPECPAGSVIVYNGHCWHAGGRNESEDAYRCSCFGHYRKSLQAYPAFGGRIFQCDPAAGMPPEWWPMLSPRQKQLFGMVESVEGPPPCRTYDPDTGDKPAQLNGDFGGFQIRQFTDGQYNLVTETDFTETASAELVDAAELEEQLEEQLARL